MATSEIDSLTFYSSKSDIRDAPNYRAGYGVGVGQFCYESQQKTYDGDLFLHLILWHVPICYPLEIQFLNSVYGLLSGP